MRSVTIICDFIHRLAYLWRAACASTTRLMLKGVEFNIDQIAGSQVATRAITVRCRCWTIGRGEGLDIERLTCRPRDEAVEEQDRGGRICLAAARLWAAAPRAGSPPKTRTAWTVPALIPPLMCALRQICKDTEVEVR
ncbi:MAG: hypothetical protein ACRDYA_09690 [Egibacteraceae bacterium]